MIIDKLVGPISSKGKVSCIVHDTFKGYWFMFLGDNGYFINLVVRGALT